MRACRRNGKLRCAGHGADAVLVVYAVAALTPKGRAVGSTGYAPLRLLRGQLPERGPDPADADQAAAVPDRVPHRQGTPRHRRALRGRSRPALPADSVSGPGGPAR